MVIGCFEDNNGRAHSSACSEVAAHDEAGVHWYLPGKMRPIATLCCPLRGEKEEVKRQLARRLLVEESRDEPRFGMYSEIRWNLGRLEVVNRSVCKLTAMQRSKGQSLTIWAERSRGERERSTRSDKMKFFLRTQPDLYAVRELLLDYFTSFPGLLARGGPSQGSQQGRVN